MEIVVLIIAIALIVSSFVLSKRYNEHIERKYGCGCINWWFAAFSAISAVITFGFTNGMYFYIFLALTLTLLVLSVIFTYKEMILYGATSDEVWKSCAAQIGATIGITAVVIFIVLLIFGGGNGKKKKR